MPSYDRREQIRRAGSWIDADMLEEIAAASDWLFNRLNPDDYAIASTWDNDVPGRGGRHWLHLKTALERVAPNNHRAIDKIFADYARANELADEPLLAERERLLNQSRYGWFHDDSPELYPAGSRLLHEFQARRAAEAYELQRDEGTPPRPSLKQRFTAALRATLHL